MERERENESFEEAKSVVPPAYLFGRIMSRIGIEKKLTASRKKTAYFSFALAVSIAAFMGALFALKGALIESEVSKLISVIVSDPGTAAADWQDFVFFLLESLPVAYIAMFLGSLFALLESLKYMAKYAGDTFSFSKLTRHNS